MNILGLNIDSDSLEEDFKAIQRIYGYLTDDSVNIVKNGPKGEEEYLVPIGNTTVKELVNQKNIKLFLDVISADYAKVEKEIEQFKKIFDEVEDRFRWECPCCFTDYLSEKGQTKEGFAKELYNDRDVKFDVMTHMQGVFCSDCRNDPEVRDSML